MALAVVVLSARQRNAATRASGGVPLSGTQNYHALVFQCDLVERGRAFARLKGLQDIRVSAAGAVKRVSAFPVRDIDKLKPRAHLQTPMKFGVDKARLLLESL